MWSNAIIVDYDILLHGLTIINNICSYISYISVDLEGFYIEDITSWFSSTLDVTVIDINKNR